MSRHYPKQMTIKIPAGAGRIPTGELVAITAMKRLLGFNFIHAIPLRDMPNIQVLRRNSRRYHPDTERAVGKWSSR
jgi:hypothetical protein